MTRPFWRKLFRQAPPETQAGPKTYLYVSDDKVDMLTEGLSESIRDRFDLRFRSVFLVLQALKSVLVTLILNASRGLRSYAGR